MSQAAKASASGGLAMDELQVSPLPVTLFYLIELDNTIQTAVLARDTSLVRCSGRVVTAEGVTLLPGDTLAIEKRGSVFRTASARLRGSRKLLAGLPPSKLKTKHRKDWDIVDVVEYVVKPAVEDRGGADDDSAVALACTLDHRHVHDDNFGAGEAYYVSVDKATPLSQLVDALKVHFEAQGRDPSSVYLWVDFMQVDPMLLDDDDFVREYEASVGSRMALCGGHLLFLNKWGFRESKDHPYIDSLQRDLVLWEVYQAAVSGVATSAIMPKRAVAEMLGSFRGSSHGLRYFEDVVDGVRLSAPGVGASGGAPDADKGDLVDSEALLEGVRGGAAAVEGTIHKHLRVWVAHRFVEELPALRKRKDVIYDQLARSVNRSAVVHSRNNEVDEAIRLFDMVVELQKLGTGGAHPATAFALNNKALLLQKKGDDGDAALAAELMAEAISVLEKVRDSAPKVAIMVSNLVNILASLPDTPTEDQEPHLLKLVRLEKMVHGADHVKVALALDRLGRVQVELKKVDEAKETLLEALRILERDTSVSVDDDDLAAVIDDLATVYDLESNHEPGEGSHHVAVARSLYQLAKVYKEAELQNEHRAMGERALSILQTVLGEDHPETKRYEDEMLTN